MSVINLRSVPEDLYRSLKKASVDASLPFHAFCVQMLASAMDEYLAPERAAAARVRLAAAAATDGKPEFRILDIETFADPNPDADIEIT